MNSHLSHDQIAKWIAGEDTEVSGLHLATCDACRGEVEEWERDLSCFRESNHAASQKKDVYWRMQQIAISERLPGKHWLPAFHWIWATAAVAALAAALLLTRPQKSSQRPAKEEADEALLQQIQSDLGRQFPKALAPAVLITKERNKILTSKDIQQTNSQIYERR